MRLLTDSTPPRTTLQRAARCAIIGALLAIAAAGSLWRACQAQEDTAAAEYKIKAAFLYKFASYVEWPAQVFDRHPQAGILSAD